MPEKIEIFRIFLENRNFFVKLPKKSKFFQICLEKLKIFVKVPVKNRNFLEICPEKLIFCLSSCLKKSKFFLNFPRKSKFFDPDPRPPRFQTRLTPLA